MIKSISNSILNLGSNDKFKNHKLLNILYEAGSREMGRDNIFNCWFRKNLVFLKTSKKTITPVVATALLLVVTVVAVVGFQTWYNTYSSVMFSDVDITINSASDGTLKIESLIGDILYIINNLQDNLSITTLKIGGNICTVTDNLTLGMNQIPVSSCVNNLSTSTPDIVLITEKNVISKKVFIKNTITSSSLDCSTLNGGEWIKVPGNSVLGTNDFCVMKYEAKNVSGIATSQITLTPWVDITWQNAKLECESLGAGYHLITDNEWLTIAKNVEQQPSNWNSSIVGTGFMYSGHNDGGPFKSLAASTDNDPYNGTENVAGSNQRRTLNLSNGEVIWDLAGNVWEWVNDSMPNASRYHGGDQQWMSYNGDDGTGKVASLVPNLMLPSNGWNAYQGMGRYYDGYSLAGTYNNINESPDFCTGYCSFTAVFLRGGNWYDGAYAGAFALILNDGPSHSGSYDGFRCSYEP